MNNTQLHISDQASTVLVDLTETPFDSSVKNVQDALDSLGPHSLIDGLPIADYNTAGIIDIATNADIDTGTDENSSVTPAGLAYALENPGATETELGWARYATNTEAENTSRDNVAITPKNLHYIFDTRKATQTLSGTSTLSTKNQAEAGSNNTSVMTPLRVKQAIDAQIPTVAEASESVVGTVQLSTVAETKAGTVRDAMAISPYSFARANATESNFGTAKIATQGQTNSLSSDSVVVTPKKLGNLNASTSSKGLVELATGSQTSGLSQSNVAVTPSSLNSLNASTSSKGLVELATGSQTKSLNSGSVAVTPASLNSLNADRDNKGLVKLTNSIISSNESLAATAYAVKRVNDKIDSLENDVNEWEELYNYGRSYSTSSVLNISRSKLDGYEFKVVYRDGGGTLWNIGGVYSNYFNNGNTPGVDNQNAYYNARTERMELPRGEDRFIIVMRRRIPWIPQGYTYTGGGYSGGSGGGGTGGGGGNGPGSGGAINPL